MTRYLSCLLIIFIFFSSCSYKQESTTSSLRDIDIPKNTLNKSALKDSIEKYLEGFVTIDSLSVFNNRTNLKISGKVFKQFSPIEGKMIGIWADNASPSWDDYRNKYGFSGIIVWDINSYRSAKEIGFPDENIMLILHDYSSGIQLINSIKGPNYYHADEPFEDSRLNLEQLQDISYKISSINSDGKLLISSYKWPSLPFGLPFSFDTYGDKYKSVLNSCSNAFIICDEYRGNIMGSVEDYWSIYREYYGRKKNFSAWMNVELNKHNSLELLQHADSLNIRNIWLYAGGISYRENIYNFCESAYKAGWMKGYAQEFTVILKCTNGDCPPADEQGWKPEQITVLPGLIEVLPK